MSVIATTMYTAGCDYPGCKTTSNDSNNTMYFTEHDLAQEFKEGIYDGSLWDDYGWIAVDGKHFCGEHTEWDESGLKLIPVVLPAEETINRVTADLAETGETR